MLLGVENEGDDEEEEEEEEEEEDFEDDEERVRPPLDRSTRAEM